MQPFMQHGGTCTPKDYSGNMFTPGCYVYQNGMDNYVEQNGIVFQLVAVPVPVWPQGQVCSLLGQVWNLSKDPAGCRVVQDALENAACDDDRIMIASELQCHVWEAIKCHCANYVLQKIIHILPAKHSQFIVDEIVGSGPKAVTSVARHRFGCRILQRLLEVCTASQLYSIIEALLLEADILASHIYGNYVISHLFEHGCSPNQLSRLFLLLAEHATAVGTRGYGCAVLKKAFESPSAEEQKLLATAILMDPALFISMACSRNGQDAVKMALPLAEPSLRDMAVQSLLDQKVTLKASRYGRTLYNYVETLSAQIAAG